MQSVKREKGSAGAQKTPGEFWQVDKKVVRRA
jgi:hypothetical protein